MGKEEMGKGREGQGRKGRERREGNEGVHLIFIIISAILD